MRQNLNIRNSCLESRSPYFDHSYKNKRGLQYDLDLDRAIFHELDLFESISSGELKTRIDKSLGRTIVPSVYYAHITKMSDEHDIERTDTGKRGKPSVFYSLTDEAKRKWKLNIHRLNPDCTLFTKIYEKLLFYEFEGTPFIISSEDDFDKLLQAEFNTTKDKLDWGRVSDAENTVIVDELYPPYSNTRIGKKHQKFHKKEMEEYWKGRGQKTAFEQVESICHPVRDDVDIWIVKTEYWEINKNYKHKKYDSDYRLELPGVAMNEILNNNFIGTGKFNQEDVEKAASLLIQEGVLESCMVFRGQTRYKIADQRLRHMIETLRDFHYGEFNILLCKWEDFEKPTDKEIERTGWLLGVEESERIFRSAEMKRDTNRELMKTSKSLEEYHNRYLSERMVPQFMTAEYYNAYLTGRVVPHFKESMFSMFDQYRLYHELEGYNRERRNPGIRKRGGRQDILKFHKYRRECLAHFEQSLQWDAEGLKLENADVLEEYKFLHNAIRMICPLVFELPNADLQTEIVGVHLVKEQATKKFAKMTGATYAGNAYDYKRKKRVSNKTITYYDRITGRQTRAKCVYMDLDN